MTLFSRLSLMVLSLFTIGTISSTADACTGIKLKASDGGIVHGRTLEFGLYIDCSVIIVPRGYEFSGTTPIGPGLSYKAKYGSLGIIAFDQPAMMDGMNEKGLSVGTFYFPGFATYTKTTAENQSKSLSPVEFSNWLLVSFATVEEVKEALSQVVIAPTSNKEWGNMAPPFHYIVFDKAGNSLVIEPIDGKLVTYDNRLGVLTNSPSFDWHMTNLRNFINLTPYNVKPVNLEGIEFAQLGQGSGMVGIPGDFTPTSRFVRAAIFSSTATPSKTAAEAIFQGFHILHQFDIPVGVSRDEANGVVHSDYTQVTCMRDPQALKYYFTTYVDQAIHMIDLNKFDLNAKELKKFSAKVDTTPVVDITSKLNNS